jgi:hypothetical protein
MSNTSYKATEADTTPYSVLELPYQAPKRPYSQNELKAMRSKLYRELRLGKVRAEHQKCGHFYLVKENGRKEKDILEQKTSDCGNCSVCWKLSKTPRDLRNSAQNLIKEYGSLFFDEDTVKLSFDGIDIETCFYKWLCVEFI